MKTMTAKVIDHSVHPLRPRAAVAEGDLPARVSIFRPFFLAGIFSVLTTGCMMGAVALYGIAQRASYTASATTPYVLAHANSQLFGWVGLFVMGFALQIHPPRRSRTKLYHQLAGWSLGLIAVAIALRFAAEPLVDHSRALWMPVGVLSGVLEALAVLLFIANSGMTRAKTFDESSGKAVGLPWQSLFVFASLGWWLAVSLVEPVVFALSHQPDKTTSILFVAKWFVPYRDSQFLGFVVNMIFGVALARFAAYFHLPEADRRLGLTGFVLWNAGLFTRCFGWVSMFNAGMQPGTEWTYYVGGLLLAAGALYLVAASRAFERSVGSEGSVGVGACGSMGSMGISGVTSHTPHTSHTTPTFSLKYVRTALAWLLLSGVLFVLEPLHLRAVGAPFSHAYTGAIRHALTVGFISQMILGVSTFAVPRLRGRPEMSITASWAVLLLLNVGNTMRVALQILTDYTPAAFAPMGISGFVELVALLIWAGYMVRTVAGRQTGRQPSNIAPALV
jgi:hypothetical protein